MRERHPASTAPATTSRWPALVPLPTPQTAPAARPGELWLAAHFPRLPLDAVLPGASRAHATVVTTLADPLRRIVACNERAARRGIAPGMGLNAALALVPELQVEERRPATEAALLDRLGRWALQFTPVVSLEPPGAVLAEVRGSLDLFGGAMALLRRALDGLSASGLSASLAFAPTPRGALWLARAGLAMAVTRVDAMAGIASRLPLSCLCWPEDVAAALAGLGIGSVADLIRLPRAGFAARFGPRLLDELDEGLGRRPGPRRRHVVPERFDERVESPIAAEGTDVLQVPLRQLLAQLEACLRARASGIRELRLDLLHHGEAPTRLRVASTRLTGDSAHFGALLDLRLARCRLTAPVIALRLRSGALQPLVLRDAGLFDRGRNADPEATARLLDLLRARLGHEAVFGVAPVSEHRPERAFRIAEPGTESALPAPWAGACPRPLWMLAEPQPLDGWEGTFVTGPERIETGWWDGHDVRRDYYVVLSRAGVRLWVFRERPPGQRWFLHGIFG